MEKELIVPKTAVASTPVNGPEKVDPIDNIVDILKAWPVDRVSLVLRTLQAFEADPQRVADLFGS